MELERKEVGVAKLSNEVVLALFCMHLHGANPVEVERKKLSFRLPTHESNNLVTRLNFTPNVVLPSRRIERQLVVVPRHVPVSKHWFDFE